MALAVTFCTTQGLLCQERLFHVVLCFMTDEVCLMWQDGLAMVFYQRRHGAVAEGAGPLLAGCLLPACVA